MSCPEIVAIDGPAASGKTTVGAMLAQHLNYRLVDTGSMYRALTLAALRDSVAVNDEAALAALADRIELDILPSEGDGDGRSYTLLLNGEDVTWELRSEVVDESVSTVAAWEDVRREMVERQRRLAAAGQVVMIGRDIGTVVLPDAPIKLYITASAAERAHRRWQERRARGEPADYEAILADVNRRDELDRSRKHSPMRPAADATIVDTTGRSPEWVTEQILSLLKSVFSEQCSVSSKQ